MNLTSVNRFRVRLFSLPSVLLIFAACGTEATVEPTAPFILGLDSEITAQQSALRDYIAANLCSPTKPSVCLEALSVRLKGRDDRLRAPVTVYRIHKSREVGKPLYAHLLRDYLDKLRDATLSNKTAPELQRLYDQVSYMRTLGHFHPESAPENQRAFVWESNFGFADAMVQAEYAYWFQDAADRLLRHARTNASTLTPESVVALRAGASDWLNLSHRMFMSFEHTQQANPSVAHSGGVRSASFQCGPTYMRRSCWYLFSSGGHDENDKADAVINQAGAALWDLYRLYRDSTGTKNLVLGAGEVERPTSLGSREQYRSRILNVIEGTLHQMAFAKGTSAERPRDAPRLNQFIVPWAGSHRFSYSYDIPSRAAVMNTSIPCAYNKHTAQKLGDLLKDLADRDNLGSRAIEESAKELLRPGNALHLAFVGLLDDEARRRNECYKGANTQAERDRRYRDLFLSPEVCMMFRDKFAMGSASCPTPPSGM